MTVNSCSNRPPLLELEKSKFERKIGSRTELTSQSQPNSKNVANSVCSVGVFVEKGILIREKLLSSCCFRPVLAPL